jgi:hypothetical protein
MNAKKRFALAAVRRATLVASVLAVALAIGNPNQDKTGTNAKRSNKQGSQVACSVQLASLGSLQAERGGFEPPVPVSQHTAFPVPHNRPLCHLSGVFAGQEKIARQDFWRI